MVAGELGAAAAGVALLRAGKKSGPLIAAYVRPVPRLDVARALAGTRAVRGAIDVSDGLSSDLIHLCEAGGVGCEIQAGPIPIARGVSAFCRSRALDPVEWALHSGEDYALILSIPQKFTGEVSRAIEAAGARVSIIGRFTRERGAYRIIDRQGRERAFRSGGWDHMRKGRR